ncbi:MAG TPA: tryptophan--tRNA ligase, partial [Desulfosarcina sp.]|nr:tryptophan--tRNA ligase [Desulfosarcina sp.]
MIQAAMKSPPTNTIALTGIKPTGRIHLGNYLGSIRPALGLASEYSAYYFIADYHALTTVHDPQRLNRQIREAAATWLAVGLNPEEAVFYRQSAVPEIFELMWVLACVSAKGLLNRAHAYKAALDANLEAGKDADANVNAGLFNYPLLMAADILSFQADLVPVGRDQRQHVEVARDIAAAFNRTFAHVFNLPQAAIGGDVQKIAGLDGRKMSKSYGNEIPLMAEPDVVRELVMRIVTDSRRPEEPKDPDQCSVFTIYRHFAGEGDVARLRQRYLAGGVAYREVKESLADLLINRFAPA